MTNHSMPTACGNNLGRLGRPEWGQGAAAPPPPVCWIRWCAWSRVAWGGGVRHHPGGATAPPHGTSSDDIIVPCVEGFTGCVWQADEAARSFGAACGCCCPGPLVGRGGRVLFRCRLLVGRGRAGRGGGGLIPGICLGCCRHGTHHHHQCTHGSVYSHSLLRVCFLRPVWYGQCVTPACLPPDEPLTAAQLSIAALRHAKKWGAIGPGLARALQQRPAAQLCNPRQDERCDNGRAILIRCSLPTIA